MSLADSDTSVGAFVSDAEVNNKFDETNVKHYVLITAGHFASSVGQIIFKDDSEKPEVFAELPPPKPYGY